MTCICKLEEVGVAIKDRSDVLVWVQLADSIVGKQLTILVRMCKIGLENIVDLLLTGRVICGNTVIAHICEGSER